MGHRRGSSPQRGEPRRPPPNLPRPTCYAAFRIVPFMTTEALLDASCKVLDERCAYRAVTFESEWPSSCETSYKVRPEFTRNEAN
jgi:hypothetical protein